MQAKVVIYVQRGSLINKSDEQGVIAGSIMENLTSADKFKYCKVGTTTLSESSCDDTPEKVPAGQEEEERIEPKELPKAVQENRAGQLKVRVQANPLLGQLCKSTGKKPKGSRNVPKGAGGVKAPPKAKVRSENECQEEIIDFNSSFDEIDSKFMAGAPKENEKEASQQDGEQGKCEVVFRTPMRRFTFNPLMTSFEEVASHLINNSNEAAGLSKLDVARWT